MITLQDFLDIKGKLDNANYVCSRVIKTHPTFKAVKVLTINVYSVNNANKTDPIVSASISGTIATDELDNAWNNLEKEVIWKMLCK